MTHSLSCSLSLSLLLSCYFFCLPYFFTFMAVATQLYHFTLRVSIEWTVNLFDMNRTTTKMLVTCFSYIFIFSIHLFTMLWCCFYHFFFSSPFNSCLCIASVWHSFILLLSSCSVQIVGPLFQHFFFSLSILLRHPFLFTSVHLSIEYIMWSLLFTLSHTYTLSRLVLIIHPVFSVTLTHRAIYTFFSSSFPLTVHSHLSLFSLNHCT